MCGFAQNRQGLVFEPLSYSKVQILIIHWHTLQYLHALWICFALVVKDLAAWFRALLSRRWSVWRQTWSKCLWRWFQHIRETSRVSWLAAATKQQWSNRAKHSKKTCLDDSPDWALSKLLGPQKIISSLRDNDFWGFWKNTNRVHRIVYPSGLRPDLCGSYRSADRSTEYTNLLESLAF